MKPFLTIALVLLLATTFASAQESALQRLDDALSYQSPGGFFRFGKKARTLSRIAELRRSCADCTPSALSTSERERKTRG